MRSAVVLAFAAGALAVPYKRDVVTDYDIVYETDVVTVWANAQETSYVAVDAAEPTSSSSAAAVQHYGHNHWSKYWSSQSATSESATPTPSSTSTYVAPTTPSSTYVAPTTTSEAPPPPTYAAPTTSSTSVYVAPTTSSTSVYVAPTTSSTSTWVAPTTSSSSTWAAPSSAAPAKPTSYSEIAVYHHNLHRANHSAPDIAWDDSLASSAATIAASCVYEHNTGVDGGNYGQNIAAGVEAANISLVITDLFYNGEVGWFEGLYEQAQPSMKNFPSWGHFTQIVWKDTTHVGCATQYCPGGLGNIDPKSNVPPYFTVCNYKNPGNYANEYAANVGVSLKQKSVEWNAGL